jgi:hypothetical protein
MQKELTVKLLRSNSTPRHAIRNGRCHFGLENLHINLCTIAQLMDKMSNAKQNTFNFDLRTIVWERVLSQVNKPSYCHET